MKAVLYTDKEIEIQFLYNAILSNNLKVNMQREVVGQKEFYDKVSQIE